MTDEIPKDGITSDNQKLYELQNEDGKRRGLPSLEKAQGLGPCSVEIRGFKSHPPHTYSGFNFCTYYSSVILSTLRINSHEPILTKVRG